MAKLTNYAENLWIGYLLGSNLAQLTNLYIGFTDGDPGENGTGATEVTATLRPAGRVGISFGSYAAGQVTNNLVIDFGDADGTATVAGFVIGDSATPGQGNIYAYGTISSQSINAGTSLTIAANDLVLSSTGGLGPVYRQRLLEWLSEQTIAAAPATLYCALYNGQPTSGGTEVTTTIRTAGRLATTFTDNADGTIQNTGAVNFGQANAGATITWGAIMDASSAGNIVFEGDTPDKVVSAGTAVNFAAGVITFAIQ